jgi:hypothetical protein
MPISKMMQLAALQFMHHRLEINNVREVKKEK